MFQFTPRAAIYMFQFTPRAATATSSVCELWITFWYF